MQNKWNYHGPPRKNNELKEYLNWIFEIEDVVLFKLYLKVSWIADNCLVKSAVISNLSNLQNMSNLLTFWLSDHPEVGKFFKILSIFHFNMLTLRIGPFRNFEKKFSFFENFSDHPKILVDFDRFLPILSLNISRMAKNDGLWSFASALYPFYLASDQVSSNSIQRLLRKCRKTTQKMHENWPSSCRFFTQKMASRQKSDETMQKGNFL